MGKRLAVISAGLAMAVAHNTITTGQSSATGKPTSGYQRPKLRLRPYKRTASPAARVLLAAQERRKAVQK